MRLNKITLALLGLSFAQFAVADNADNTAAQPETTAQSEVSSEASASSSEAQTQTLQNVTVQARPQNGSRRPLLFHCQRRRYARPH